MSYISFILAFFQETKNGIAAQKQETNMLVKSNRFARSKLAGDKIETISIPCSTSDHDESESESETAVEIKDCDKENLRVVSGAPRTHPNSEAARSVNNVNHSVSANLSSYKCNQLLTIFNLH